MTAAEKCPRCHRLGVRPRTGSGRKIPFRVFADLAVPDDMPLVCCGECGATFFDAATTEALGPTLAKQYDQRLCRLAREALRKIRPYVSQRRLELELGLSQAYLTKVKTIGGVSAPLVALLMLIAESPAERLAELRRCWASAWNEGSEEHDRTDGHRQLADGRKAAGRRGKIDASHTQDRVCEDDARAAEAELEQGRKRGARRRARQQVYE